MHCSYRENLVHQSFITKCSILSYWAEYQIRAKQSIWYPLSNSYFSIFSFAWHLLSIVSSREMSIYSIYSHISVFLHVCKYIRFIQLPFRFDLNLSKALFLYRICLLLSLIHIWRCRRIERCRSRWSPYH